MNEQSNAVSLYRRWRPRRFADVVGQDEIVRVLRNAVGSGDVAHAYLLAGERGIGKTTIARILARAVNCQQPADGEPCNQCGNCTAIQASRSLDIVEIDGASNRGIDHIRRLREEVSFAPTDLVRKVYIIDEVHMLTNEAFNALLKTLEEPPPHAMFIFATTEPHKVPRTIISRCQTFEFRRISPANIATRLAEVAEAESASATPEAIALISRRANGGMRDALVMLEQAMSYGGEQITATAVLDMLGLVDREVHEAFVQAISSGNRASVMDSIETLADRGKDLDIFLDDVIHLLRERMIADEGPSLENILIAKRLLEIKGELFRSLDRRIRLEVGLLDLMNSIGRAPDAPPIRPEASPAPRRAAKRTSSAPQRPESGARLSATAGEVAAIPVAPSPRPTSEPHGESSPPRAVLSPEITSTWDSMLHEIEQDRIAIAAFLTEGHPVLEGETLRISFHPEHSFHKDSLEKRDNVQYLAGVVRRHFGDSVHVEVRIDETVERKPLPHELLRSKAELVCRVFDGRIVKEEL
ncbi:DNA polymerase III subunit gamma/tau [Candidatus Bipolaricaulota bacterium]|nr:DNA polymerase III subunit gamma/tau [Candidatus Bipolaricaulota bacterium]